MKKYWEHPGWWNSKEPYGPYQKDWWWYGEREAPWLNKQGYYDKGKWVPLDTANHIQDRLGKEVESLRKDLTQQEINLEQQMKQIKQIHKEAEDEKSMALANIGHLKERLKDTELGQDIQNRYIYKIMENSHKERDMLINKRTEVLPEITTMPKIDKVHFELPKEPLPRYDSLNPLPQNMKFMNSQGKDSLDKMNTKV